METPSQTSLVKSKAAINPIKQQHLQDELNQKRFSDAQRQYLKCAWGRCPIVITDRMKRIRKFFGNKKKKPNYVSARKHDKKLSKLFQEKGRKKRIEILQVAVSELNLKLQVANSKLHVNEIEENYRKIEEHLRIQDDMREDIKKAKKEIVHIKSQIERLDKKSLELDQETESEVQFKEHLKRANRQLEIYERKVELSKQNESKMTAENEKLRELLHDMLLARAQFNKFWEIYMKSLNNKKNYLLDMIERSSLAFSQNDEFLDNYQRLLSRRRQDKETTTAEMLKIKRKIDADDIITMFLGSKGKRRHWQPLQQCELDRRENVKKVYTEELNFYKSIISEVKKWIGMADNEEISQKTLNDMRNWNIKFFELYKYSFIVSIELNDATKEMSKYANEVKDNFDKTTSTRNDYAKKVKDMTDEFAKSLQDQSNMRKEIKTKKAFIDAACKSISDVIKTIKCDVTSLETKLVDCSQVRQRNFHHFLALLEQHLNRLLAFIYCKQRDDKRLDLLTVNKKLVVKSLHRDFEPIAKIEDLFVSQCPECAALEDVKRNDSTFVEMMTMEEIDAKAREIILMPNRMHSISECKLPHSGTVAARRYAQ